MNKSKNPLREQLLALGEPTRSKLVRHQQETQVMLEKLERRLRLEKWYSGVFWIYAVLFMTACLLIVGYRAAIAPDIAMLAFAFVILICGGIEIVKHFINRSRVEVLKELKSLELHVLALEERLSNAPR
jgi:hypothetical protein